MEVQVASSEGRNEDYQSHRIDRLSHPFVRLRVGASFIRLISCRVPNPLFTLLLPKGAVGELHKLSQKLIKDRGIASSLPVGVA